MPRKMTACQRNADNIPAWLAQGLSLSEVARRCGTNNTRLREWLHAQGLQVPKWDNQLARNGRWMGGRVIDKDGYALLKRPDHPRRNRHDYVREHRLVMEEKLGRYLEPGEVVHHKDGDKLNNHPDNLELFRRNADHLATTLKGKCPRWTEGGLQRIREGIARGVATRRAASLRRSEQGAQPSPQTPDPTTEQPDTGPPCP
jgi:hypothetical protein